MHVSPYEETGRNPNGNHRLAALLLALLLLPALLPNPTSAQEAKEDLELVLNEDGTLLIKGVVEALLDNFTAAGSGDLTVKAQPTEVEGQEGFELVIAGSGEFTLVDPLDLDRVVLRITGEGDMKNANAEIYLLIENVVLGGNAINGELTLKASSSPVEGEPNSFRTTIEGSIDLSLPIDAETAAQLSGMLGMLNAGIVNMQLSQMGMTFMRFEELDLTGLRIEEGLIQGSFRIALVINYDDYVTWYQATLYEQQMDPQEIERLGAELRTTISKLLSEKAYAKFLVELTLEKTRAAYNVDISAQATRAFLDAYIRYLDLLGRTTPAQPMAGPMAPIEVPLQPQEPPLALGGELTLAMKPIDIYVELRGDGQKGALMVMINELYLTKREAPPTYQTALDTLRALSSEGNDTIDRLTIRLDKPAEDLSLEPLAPLDQYVQEKEAHRLVLANVPPNTLSSISLRGAKAPQLTTPITTTTPTPTETPTQPPQPTETETQPTETTTTPTQTPRETPSPTPTPTETRETPTPTQTQTPQTETTPTQTTPEQTTSPPTAVEEKAEEEETGLLGGNNMILLAVGLIVVLAAVALLKR